MGGYLHTVGQAEAFWGALRAASIEILKHYGLPTTIGNKHYGDRWLEGKPLGVTEHFTAGISWKGSLSWLGDGPHDNSVSCQLMILDRMPAPIKAIYDKYPELVELQVAVILQSEGLTTAWHAGWMNRRTIGIENRNAGPLKGKAGDWRWWPKGWKAKFPHEGLDKAPLLIDGKWWEPYTGGQVRANITVCQYAHALYQEDGGLDPRWFLPHSATTGSKWDTGRAYPLHDVRDAVFAQMPLEAIPWLKAYEWDPAIYIDDLDEEEEKLFLTELEERQADRQGIEEDEPIPELPDPELQDLVQAGSWKEELDSVRKALHLLGYVTGGQGPTLDEDTALAVYQFQRSQKDLKADKIPGDSTQRALWGRLRDFRLA